MLSTVSQNQSDPYEQEFTNKVLLNVLTPKIKNILVSNQKSSEKSMWTVKNFTC